jgi:hypothetical protein
VLEDRRVERDDVVALVSSDRHHASLTFDLSRTP